MLQMYGLILNYDYEMWIIFNVLEHNTLCVYDNVKTAFGYTMTPMRDEHRFSNESRASLLTTAEALASRRSAACS